jgi:glutaredoxin
MTLRTANINLEGVLTEEAELDSRVCDCCQTSGAMTSAGPVFVYRDRTNDEHRDISIVRKVKGQWTSPKTIFNDQWKIAGCPVNGPRIAANRNQVAIAWFSAPNDVPQVKITFSSDNGANFEAPITIDKRNPLGRVDVAINEKGTAYVSWLSFKNGMSQIKVVAVNRYGTIGNPIVISETNSSRSSGFPQMELFKNELYFAWTNTSKKQKNIDLARIKL